MMSTQTSDEVVYEMKNGSGADAGALSPVVGLLRRVQRNHALEHATINLLSQRYPKAQIFGFSGPMGFTLYSTLTAEEVIPATREALRQLRAGESELAIHENCGTNLVVTAVLTTLATVLGLGPLWGGKRRFLGFLERLPQAVLLNSVALVVAKPLSRWVQATLTTDANLADTDISSFFTDYQGGMHRVRVHTRRVRAGES
jgi:hypothetical protein